MKTSWFKVAKPLSSNDIKASQVEQFYTISSRSLLATYMFLKMLIETSRAVLNKFIEPLFLLLFNQIVFYHYKSKFI